MQYIIMILIIIGLAVVNYSTIVIDVDTNVFTNKCISNISLMNKLNTLLIFGCLKCAKFFTEVR